MFISNEPKLFTTGITYYNVKFKNFGVVNLDLKNENQLLNVIGERISIYYKKISKILYS